MSWLFSRALVAESLGVSCLDGELSSPLSVTPTPHKFWRNDKTMEPCDLSQFGLTCAVLTESRGAELLTLYRAGFPAKTSALQAKEPESKVPGQECGSTCGELLAKYDPAVCGWRTVQPSLLEDWGESSVTWPRSGMTAGGLCWQLPMLGRSTGGSGFGFWPTPTASDAHRCRELKLESLGRRASVPGAHWNFAEHVSAELDWLPKPGVCRVVDGVAEGLDQLKALGNGQVPLCSATAYQPLEFGG